MNTEVITKLKSLDVEVVAVSKYHTKEEIDECAKLGLTTFGENKVQDLLKKYDDRYHWHLIGHLQTNKVKYVVGKVDLIQSVDSLKLAKEIEKVANRNNVVQDILVQIKISNDESKTGLALEDLPSLLEEIATYKHICVKGFMGVASNCDDEEIIVKEFDTMKDIFDKYKTIYPSIETLSMGMSGDYELAIKHGSNMIRVGSLIFN